MIYGVDHANNIFTFMMKLDLWEKGTVLSVDSIPSYAVRWGCGVVWDEAQDQELEDELSDLTEEELRIMNAYDKGYEEWFGRKYIDNIILSEDSDEDN